MAEGNPFAGLDGPSEPGEGRRLPEDVPVVKGEPKASEELKKKLANMPGGSKFVLDRLLDAMPFALAVPLVFLILIFGVTILVVATSSLGLGFAEWLLLLCIAAIFAVTVLIARWVTNPSKSTSYSLSENTPSEPPKVPLLWQDVANASPRSLLPVAPFDTVSVILGILALLAGLVFPLASWIIGPAATVFGGIALSKSSSNTQINGMFGIFAGIGGAVIGVMTFMARVDGLMNWGGR